MDVTSIVIAKHFEWMRGQSTAAAGLPIDKLAISKRLWSMNMKFNHDNGIPLLNISSRETDFKVLNRTFQSLEMYNKKHKREIDQILRLVRDNQDRTTRNKLTLASLRRKFLNFRIFLPVNLAEFIFWISCKKLTTPDSSTCHACLRTLNDTNRAKHLLRFCPLARNIQHQLTNLVQTNKYFDYQPNVLPCSVPVLINAWWRCNGANLLRNNGLTSTSKNNPSTLLILILLTKKRLLQSHFYMHQSNLYSYLNINTMSSLILRNSFNIFKKLIN